MWREELESTRGESSRVRECWGGAKLSRELKKSSSSTRDSRERNHTPTHVYPPTYAHRQPTRDQQKRTEPVKKSGHISIERAQSSCAEFFKRSAQCSR
jgi:hypothetical protein